MRARIVNIAAVTLMGFWFAQSSHAQTTTVRGQLLGNGQSPASGVQVTLYSQAFGRSSPVVTGGDGMYSFNNIPFGDYNLEIWISRPPRVYPVRIAASPFHDLPRFPVP